MNDKVLDGSFRGWDLLVDEANLIRLAGQPEDAYVAVTDVIELLGDSSRAFNVRALCLDDLGRGPEALTEFQRAVHLDPENAILVGNLGCAFADAGRLDEAVATIRQALTLDDELGYLYQRLAVIARKRGDEVAATKELRQAELIYARASERTPFNRGVWMNLFNVRRSLGDYEAAERARQMILEIDHTEKFEGKADAVIWGPNAFRV
jgi:tetratricopeptide (TPR) repeat protein